MNKYVTVLLLVLFSGCMIVVVMRLFPVGGPRLPGYADFNSLKTSTVTVTGKADSTAQHYNRNAAIDIGVTSVVCAVILDYRGYDTLFEVTALFAATIAILSILGKDSE